MKEARSRKFSKQIVVSNLGALWLLIYTSMFTNQIAVVLAPALGAIAMIFGIYAGVGHMDMRVNPPPPEPPVEPDDPFDFPNNENDEAPK